MARNIRKVTIALAGNPNSGKSTVFNKLTGERQRVGNYPGVTVEKKEGELRYKNYDISVVDLPGVYSLTAYSIDELVARQFLTEEKPDAVINIIDSSNLERNLYLATQFMELGVPLILAFNMSDIAEKQGLLIDKKRLSELLGAPIVFTIANKGMGMDELLEESINLIEGKTNLRKMTVGYGREIQEELTKLDDILIKDEELAKHYPSRWLGVKLLENDSEVIKTIENSQVSKEILDQLEKSTQHLKGIFGDDPEAVIADRRYGFISGACSEAVQRSYEIRHTISDRIDMVLLNKLLGLPIFIGIMWLVFKFTFTLSKPLMGWIEAGQGWLGQVVSYGLSGTAVLQSLVVDGIIGGVGNVLVFLPIIVLLFLAMSLLGDTGYMARAAFIMDRFMHKIGLHGRSFIPLLLGFGCNLPAIMATRTIEDRKDRFVTILINPFMSCGARLTVYTLFIGAFFPEKIAGNVLFSLYFLGVIVAIVMAKIFRRYLFKGEAAPFVMELPPYRIPTIKGLLTHMWAMVVVYLRKAATIIFAGCVIVWFLSNFPWNPSYSRNYDTLIKEAQGDQQLIVQLENEKLKERLENSYAGRIGKAISPIFKPLGFDDWKVSVGLVGGFIAKEIVVGTLGTLHAVGESDVESETLRKALQNVKRPDGSKIYSPLVAYSLMVFVLLYVPCLATAAVIKSETKSWKWPLFTILYSTTIAWVAAFIIYQGGKALGFGA